jgi:hypothetical protein
MRHSIIGSEIAVGIIGIKGDDFHHRPWFSRQVDPTPPLKGDHNQPRIIGASI